MGTFSWGRRALMGLILATAAGLASGCAMSTKTALPPARSPVLLRSASKAELIERFSALANSISAVNMAVTIRLTAGSSYTGTIEQYHEINGFILAQKPSKIRVIGQVPVVGKNIFDMESDGKTFRIFIPSKNQFVVGPADLERPSSKPIENLRPQHLLDAIFWPRIEPGMPVLVEETTVGPANFYVMTLVRIEGANARTSAASVDSTDWAIARKIWFDRSDLNVVRMDTFDAVGKPVALARYSEWDTFGSVRYPRQILLNRPVNDYQLQIMVTRLTANEAITADRFDLPQPPGTELVRVGEDSEEKRP